MADVRESREGILVSRVIETEAQSAVLAENPAPQNRGLVLMLVLE